MNLSIQTTCILTWCNLSIQTTCILTWCNLSIQTTCIQTWCNLSIQTICILTWCNLSIQTTCIQTWCNLSWEAHIDAIISKASQRLYFLRLLTRANVSMDKLLAIYCSPVGLVVEYACQVWHGGLTKEQNDSVKNIQKRALQIIMADATYDLALQVSELPTLEKRRIETCKKLFIEIQDKNHRLHHLLPSVKTHKYNIRDENKYELPRVLIRTRKSFINWCLYTLQ